MALFFRRHAAPNQPPTLAGLGDVRTPQEVLARMHSLPPAQKGQLMGLHGLGRDQHRG